MKKVTNFREYMADEQRVSAEEREAVFLEKELILKMVEARKKQGLTQRDLSAISGVKQPAIARMESLKSMPQIDTLLKVLIPLGYTLEIVPLNMHDSHRRERTKML